MDEISLTLPWPPSINRLWRMGKGNWYSTKIYKDYQKVVYYTVNLSRRLKFDDNAVLSMTLCATPPDRRKRDLDGLFKAVWDSLQHAGLYKDDSQIKILVARMEDPDPFKVGFVKIKIVSLNINHNGG